MKTKIPPPIIALICIAINYLSTHLINPIKFPNIEIIGILILLVGLFVYIVIDSATNQIILKSKIDESKEVILR